MTIAARMLKLRRTTGDIEIPVRIFAPEQQDMDWSCRIEIGWPEGMRAIAVSGVDAVQALELAMKIIGVHLYTSDHHASGNLMWEEPGKGYGFPVTNGIRDMLVGDDKRYM